MERETKMPGEDKGVTELNNAGREDPNEVARKRENLVRGTAAATVGEDVDLAPPVRADAEPAMREATIGGVRVKVHVPSIRKNDGLAKFGPESRLPKGTLVNSEGNPHEGTGEPYGVIGDIELPDVGRLVSRVIPFEVVDEPEKIGKPAAAKKKAA